MYGVAPGASAPFYVPTPAASKNAGGRPRRKTTASFAPFRDESKLVGLRYDQTVAAEPPIPIPPPRSPLRPAARPAPRPFSWVAAQPAQPARPARTPIVVPPPRPPPPTEQHPALRTITSPRTAEDTLKRDSILAPTTPSQSHTFFDDSSDEDDDDPFAYEKINRITQVQPVQLQTRSVSPSIYSVEEARASESNNSGFSEALSSPALTDDNTIASVSPQTPQTSPPPHRSHSRFMRAFSFRSNSIKRLKKKSQQDISTAEGAPQLVPMGENPGWPKTPLGSLNPRAGPNSDAATEVRAFPLVPHATRPSSHSRSHSPSHSRSHSHPHPQSHSQSHSHSHSRSRQSPSQSPSPSPSPSRPADRGGGAAASSDQHSDNPTSNTPAPASAPVTTPASTPRLMPPSIRLISEELEKESQKVRSLYESGEDLHWEEGRRHSSPEPRLLVPPDEDENDSLSHLPPGRHTRPTSASTSSLHVSIAIRPSELAGGIEDWDGVEGQDVDRYGFITPHRPASRPATSGSMSVRFSPRKQRNVLIRKDSASLSLGLRRLPSRKLSARSLHTQASELSTASRRSTRSTLRQAANLLPHNRDRRLVDQAGDLLALQPGLAHISEDETADKIATELKYKEAARSDKWRRMAKVVKPGPEGQGMFFEFDTKQPKLVERTWKGIPDCWRAAAWYSFLASSAKASQKPFVTDEEIKADFHRLLEVPSPDDGQIDLDVPRTINQHIMFRKRYRGGQRLLFRVLHNLSLYFPETGYVQGMAPLAATFLSYYDEESCFVMLVRLWKYRGLNRIYQSGFEELLSALKDFESNWLGNSGHDVAQKLEELCIDPTAYATRWYLTLFNLSIPFSIQLRVWDLFMLLGSSPDVGETSATTEKGVPITNGFEILHATSMAIVDTLRETLLDSDFENAMKALTSWVPIKDERRFLEVVHAEWKRNQARLRKA